MLIPRVRRSSFGLVAEAAAVQLAMLLAHEVEEQVVSRLVPPSFSVQRAAVEAAPRHLVQRLRM